MINNLEKIQSNPVKSTISLSIPIIILLILETVYSISDTYWISGLGFSALASLGYIPMWFIFSDVFNWGGFGVVFSVVFSEAIQGVLMFFVLRFKINLQIENSSPENAV
jgi:Na+-driven multidrug efflux pump